jgi:hypothetical protein
MELIKDLTGGAFAAFPARAGGRDRTIEPLPPDRG